MIIINIEEESVDSKHIAWFVEREKHDQVISLYEVKEVYYNHPQSNNNATISRLETYCICKHKITEIDAAPLLLLEYATNNIKLNLKEK